MVFSSIPFIFYFLPIVLGGYWLVGRRFRNAWLLLASLAFYTWGGGALVLLLLASTVVDYIAGLVVARGKAVGSTTLARLGVVGSVVVNVAMLGYFKYANFLVAQFNTLGRAMGIGEIAWTSVALPIGISFFTFQSMSYTIDIATGRAKRLTNILDFALYVSLFPQLIAGPIVRFHEIADEMRERSHSIDEFAAGALRFSFGMSKKVMIADSVAPLANVAFGAAPGDLGTGLAWLGVVAYTIQIYFDFSGYSDMAIGLGMMLGFHFPENFRRPYSALSVTDFWRRWHMTLSHWFRDYVYIPLGGSRRGIGRTYANLWFVFLVTGIWHGANWTFIVWGIYHGALLAGERLFGQGTTRSEDTRYPVVRRAATLLLVVIGWAIFRAVDVGSAFGYLQAMFSLHPGVILPAEISHRAIAAFVVGALAFLLPGHIVIGRIVADTNPRRGGLALKWATLTGLFVYSIVLLAGGSFSPFLYFQF